MPFHLRMVFMFPWSSVTPPPPAWVTSVPAECSPHYLCCHWRPVDMSSEQSGSYSTRFLGASCEPKGHSLPSKEEPWKGFQVVALRFTQDSQVKLHFRLFIKLPNGFLTWCEFIIADSSSLPFFLMLDFGLFPLTGLLLWYSGKNMPERLSPVTLPSVVLTETQVTKYKSHTSYYELDSQAVCKHLHVLLYHQRIKSLSFMEVGLSKSWKDSLLVTNRR